MSTFPTSQHIELTRKTRIDGAMQYGISLARIRQADEPINDVRDALITADHAHVNDIYATIS
jgi:hypothetical protein